MGFVSTLCLVLSCWLLCLCCVECWCIVNWRPVWVWWSLVGEVPVMTVSGGNHGVLQVGWWQFCKWLEVIAYKLICLVGRLYSVDWTQDWTVGLDCGTGLRESCANRFEWLKRYRKYTASNLPRMRVFSCNTAVISVRICAWSWFVIRDLMLTSEESSYGIHWLLLANSRTQGGATRFEKDAASWAISMLLPSLTWAMLLFCWRYINSRPQTDYPLSVWERH